MLLLMINDLDFNRTNDFYAINGPREKLIILRFVCDTRGIVNSVRLMVMGTRENIVLPNDSMSPLMHLKSVLVLPYPPEQGAPRISRDR